MNVLVIGGTRFIGAAAVRALVAAGHRVAVLHRGETEADLSAEVLHLHGERGDAPLVEAALVRVEPAVVLDMVARTEQEAHGMAALLAGRVRRVVVASSIDVYRAYERLAGRGGPADPVPLAEEAPLRRSRYPRLDAHHDKLLVEQAYVDAGQPAVTRLRLPFVFGPGDYRRRVQGLLGKMRGGREIVLSPGEAAWRATRGHVEDVGAAIALAVGDERAAGQIYNLGDPLALSTTEWVEQVGRLARWSGELVIDSAAPVGLCWEHHMVVDTSRIRRELGFTEPVGLVQGLRRTVDCF